MVKKLKKNNKNETFNTWSLQLLSSIYFFKKLGQTENTDFIFNKKSNIQGIPWILSQSIPRIRKVIQNYEVGAVNDSDLLATSWGNKNV